MKYLRTAQQYYKALAGLVAPGAVVLIDAVSDDNPGITSDQWWLAGLSCIVTAGAVALAPANRVRSNGDDNS